MKKKKKLVFFVSLALLIVTIILFVVNLNKISADILLKHNDEMKYVNLESSDYLLLDSNSATNGHFDEKIYYRLTNTLVYDFDSIEVIRGFSPFQKFAKIKINDESNIYCNILSYKENEYKECGNNFYVPPDFSLPEISSDNINKLEIFIYNETDESKTIPITTITDTKEIDSFLANYQGFISNHSTKDSGAFECYIYYNNYTFEEQLYEDDLEYLLSE